MHTILLIDDDEQLAEPLQEFFARYDLNLLSEVHPEKGLHRLQGGDVDLTILDVMLPDMDGFEVCRQIRRDDKLKNMPVLMLTARGDVMDRVIGLELGADDYLAKPFEPRELVARIHNILRRSQPQSNQPETDPQQLNFEYLCIDQQRRKVTLEGNDLELTNSEYELLLMFANEPDTAFSRDDILNALRGINAELYTRSVDILVSRLRQKLKPLNCIQTVWGSGYRFLAAEA
uniref:Phosphate regulon transcriptional regulatory protein PhoB (SphR) n=1 Tax=uncultured Thiotrichaceae bacterium TaxID=298394 RepID=A0A6S6TIY2_9GAMM|nr:MAG: Phosphate regulon transcriptional regulatory protein PhoB (SphR) [uncultured Thiotrichaceae bacterium]